MAEKLVLIVDRLPTPIGEMLIVADGEGNLRFSGWMDHEAELRRFLLHQYGEGAFALESSGERLDASHAIRDYFDGNLTAIDGLAVKAQGTAFQHEVWDALRTIACGTTMSYARLAERIGRPKAVRAVGLANGANPIGVVVPCHRVIGANGKLTGYGGGIGRKEWLLRHEAAHSVQSFTLTP
jgi:methylated-DNA-[protein]-cysteine S-methyltransferase